MVRICCDKHRIRRPGGVNQAKLVRLASASFRLTTKKTLAGEVYPKKRTEAISQFAPMQRVNALSRPRMLFYRRRLD